MFSLLTTAVQESCRALADIRRRPLVSVAAVSALAAGVGSALPLASYLDQALIRSPAIADSERVVLVRDRRAGRELTVSYQQLDAIRRSPNIFSDVGGFAPAGITFPSDGSSPEPTIWCFAEGEAFRALGVKPYRGRAYATEDGASDLAPALISYQLWWRRYGANPAAIGQTIAKDSTEYRIIGVMPQQFRFPANSPDVWIPFGMEVRRNQFVSAMQVVGRIAPTMSVGSAEAGLIAQLSGNKQTTAAVSLVSIESVLSATARRAAPLLVIGAVGALLLAAAVVWHVIWGDVSALTETSIRLALGASRMSVINGVLAKSLYLSVAGNVCGFIIAQYVSGLSSIRLLDPTAARLVTVVDYRACGVVWTMSTLLVTVGCLLPSIWPWRVLEASLCHARLQAPPPAAGQLGQLLVSTQVCCATVFVICGSLTWASIVNLGRVSPGFATDELLTFAIEVPRTQGLAQAKMLRAVNGYVDKLLSHLRLIPEVLAAAATTNLPIQANGTRMAFSSTGVPREGCEAAQIRGVSVDYFRTLDLAVREGRQFIAADVGAKPAPIVVNRRLRVACWPEESPIGRVAFLGSDSAVVVGVVDDVPMFGIRKPAEPEAYVLTETLALPWMRVLLRVRGVSPYASFPAVRRLAVSLDSDVRLSRVRSIKDLMSDGEASLALRARLLGAATLAAVFVAVLGAYTTAILIAKQHRYDLAVRVALGATPRRLLGRTALSALLWTVPGLLAGAILAYWAALSLGGVLFKVTPFEPLLYGAAIGGLGFLVMLATVTGAVSITQADDLLRLLHEH